jgi:RNA polymerase sigma-70 factor (ECF subfamily)
MPERSVEEVFRRSRPVLVASLARVFGPGRLDLVEAVVQDAFVRALTEWRAGPPANAEGWIHQVAKNLAFDVVRRERLFSAKEDELACALGDGLTREPADEARLRTELADDQIAMIFVACHPCNTVPSQVVLALRTLCGLDVPAIARATFASEDAVEKRLVLARRRLRDERVSLELPRTGELGARLDAVLHVLYLMFNEAYWTTDGPELVKEEVAAEAIRLVSLLAEHPITAQSRVFALLALMYFHASRFPARVDADGTPLPLPEQDRARWSQSAIDAGLRALGASAAGEAASSYHFEAAIAAVHATSPSYEGTDWARIVSLYDQLVTVNASPTAHLGRAGAIAFRDRPADGLCEIAALGVAEPEVVDLPSYHAARAEFLARLGKRDEALAALAAALERITNEHERRYLERRAARLHSA